MAIGIVSALVTFFLGFIGTFIVRVAVVRHPLSETIVPTFIHFLLNAAAIIPVLGVVIAFIGNVYFAWVNYKLAMKE